MLGEVATVQTSRSKTGADQVPWLPPQPPAGLPGHPAHPRSASTLIRPPCFKQEPAPIEFGRLEVGVYSTTPGLARSVCSRLTLNLETRQALGREIAFVRRLSETDSLGVALGAELRFTLPRAPQLLACTPQLLA
jgi:hypothetical protein